MLAIKCGAWHNLQIVLIMMVIIRKWLNELFFLHWFELKLTEKILGLWSRLFNCLLLVNHLNIHHLDAFLWHSTACMIAWLLCKMVEMLVFLSFIRVSVLGDWTVYCNFYGKSQAVKEQYYTSPVKVQQYTPVWDLHRWHWGSGNSVITNKKQS